MAEWAVLADDFTGAMDTGLQFAKSGLSTVFDLGGASGDYDALVLSSSSRSLDPESARSAARDVAQRATSLGARVYKKIDSTLRGNIGPELEVVLQAAGVHSMVIAPAFPAQGRSTAGGTQFLRGVPVSRTEASRDPVAPVTQDHLPTLLESTSTLRAGHVALDVVRSSPYTLASRLTKLSEDGAQIIVADAETDSDLNAIAAAMKLAGMDKLSAGSAGLAERLVQAPATAVRTSPGASAVHRVVLAGSFSQVTRRQVDYAARQLDAAVYSPSDSDLANPALAVAHAAESLEAGKVWIGFAGHRGRPLQRQSAVDALDNWLGDVCLALEERFSRLGLVLTGGETGAICLERIRAGAIEIRAEVQSGIAGGVLLGGPFDQRLVVTKAGAFGKDDAILASVDWLAKGSR